MGLGLGLTLPIIGVLASIGIAMFVRRGRRNTPPPTMPHTYYTVVDRRTGNVSTCTSFEQLAQDIGETNAIRYLRTGAQPSEHILVETTIGV